ncbi:MAG TPA: hypothetical protein VF412_16725 [Bdellovibrio sp.]|uniref:hypothetical protein n=1 Tax=Bdellovibrio sp. TaxID=28201 RepID=UPI002EF901FF
MKTTTLGTFFIALALTAGCAQKTIEKVNNEVATAPAVKNTSQLRQEAQDLIEKSNLSPEIKTQLLALKASSSQQMQGLREESLKLRALLIKTVLSPNYNKKEVDVIHSKIRKNQNQYLAVMFDTVDKANGILGRETKADEQNERMMEEMFIMNHDNQF